MRIFLIPITFVLPVKSSSPGELAVRAPPQGSFSTSQCPRERLFTVRVVDGQDGRFLAHPLTHIHHRRKNVSEFREGIVLLFDDTFPSRSYVQRKLSRHAVSYTNCSPTSQLFNALPANGKWDPVVDYRHNSLESIYFHHLTGSGVLNGPVTCEP